MQRNNKDNLVKVPDITIFMNCDTCLAINLATCTLSDKDELVFVIKNYDYIDSSYAFLFKTNTTEMDENGEVIFSIDPDAAKNIKSGAFYNLAVLVNAFDMNRPTEYRKLTENGKITIEYGAHDLALPEPVEPTSPYREILAARVEPTNEVTCGTAPGAIIGVALEKLSEVDEEV